MLSQLSRPLIAATLPVIGERIGAITTDFYRRLFAAHPELLDGLFSRSHQRSGAQPQALAASIATFATHLLNHPDTLPEHLLARIAHKHASLGIAPEQYDVVYRYLFEAIAADLGDAVTPEVAAAWSEVYWLMANTLINLEKDLYSRQANDTHWAPWRVVAKTPAGSAALTFDLAPADDTPVTPATPGQFVSVRIPAADGLRQVRQYSLITPGGLERRFTSKRDDAGEISPLLHDTVQVGDVIEVSNPYGDAAPATDAPLVLISAGIGCTPMTSMLSHLAARPAAHPVTVLHSERHLETWAHREQMLDYASRHGKTTVHLWVTGDDASAFGAPAGTTLRTGRMSLADVEIPANARLYLCGPLSFMQQVRDEAIALGVAPARIHHEVFGPDAWVAA